VKRSLRAQMAASNGELARLASGVGLLLMIGVSHVRASEVRLLKSPDDRIHVSIQLPAPRSTERPIWSATFQGKPVMTNCSLGLQTADAGDLMSGVRLLREHSRAVDQRIPVLFGNRIMRTIVSRKPASPSRRFTIAAWMWSSAATTKPLLSATSCPRTPKWGLLL
jgi:hypothetical protein